MGTNSSAHDRGGLPHGAPGQRTPNTSRYSQVMMLGAEGSHGDHSPSSSGASAQVHHREKKKKASKFATLRKKLIRTRRHSRTFDYAKAMRDLTSPWMIKELNALVEDYEASVALKEVALLANLSRPHANSIKEDLSHLYDYKYCTDVDLVYQGVVFPVHRAILIVRCPFFRTLLSQYPEYGAQVPIHIRTPGIDVNMFSALMRYLYTGEFNAEDHKLENRDILMQLSDECGIPNHLEHDMRTLLDTGTYSDAVLVFSSQAEPHDMLTPDGMPDSRSSGKHELRCHKAILAARSPFFRSLLLRRARSGEELTERALQSPTCIVLDESVIPRRYARVLLHAIYLDTVDLSCIVRSSVSMCSLSEVQAMVAGKGHMTLTDEAMEIYQIGQFLDFPTLSQGCEDVIAENLAVDNLLPMLQWSAEPHGSPWVHRQALHFLREEFLQVAHSSVLYDLSRDYMLHTIQSDFLQAGELDVLSAVLKWGEHQLVRRIEDREPNLLSHTAHSVSKKGIKKRDLNDIELRDILAELLPHIRTDHVIPTGHDVLSSAIKRGLISVPPSHMLGGEDGSHSAANAWVRVNNCGVFVKPRLFMPYYEEAKVLLEEQLAQVQENEVVRLRMVHMGPSIPDTLYMVDHSAASAFHNPTSPLSSASTVDIIAGTIPVPDQETLDKMLKRECELKVAKEAYRAQSMLYADRRAVAHYVQLRVVREFGLPDSTVEVLLSHHASQPSAGFSDAEAVSTSYCPHAAPHSRMMGHRKPTFTPQPHLRPHAHMSHSPHPRAHHQHPHLHLHHTTPPAHFPRTPKQQQILTPPSPVLPPASFNQVEKELGAACAEGSLNEMMPDIAMATASLNQMSLQEVELLPPDLELDLGDGGASSHGTGSSHGGGSGTLFI